MRFIIDYCIVGLLSFYSLEIILRLLCYGLSYFSEGWNQFDFIMVLCASLSLIFSTFIHALGTSPYYVVIHIFIVGKLLILFRYAKVFHKMFQTLILALPSVFNLAILFLIMIYLFAIAGTILFADVKIQSYLSEHANFKNFWTAFITVYRMSTFDGWNDLMHDAMRLHSQYFECAMYPTYEEFLKEGEPAGCGLWYAPIFFILLELIVAFVFLNLFIAIIVGSMGEITRLSESVLNDEKLEKFQNTWRKYDPEANGYIEYSRLRSFLSDLGKPLGASEAKMTSQYYSAITMWMMELGIYHYPIDNLNYIEFYDVLEALVKRTIYRPEVLDNIYKDSSPNKLRKALEDLWEQKSQLMYESQSALRNVENLKLYYQRKAKRSDYYIKRKVKLPMLVWATLKITQNLRKNVRRRKSSSKRDIFEAEEVHNRGSRASLFQTEERAKDTIEGDTNNNTQTRQDCCRESDHIARDTPTKFSEVNEKQHIVPIKVQEYDGEDQISKKKLIEQDEGTGNYPQLKAETYPNLMSSEKAALIAIDEIPKEISLVNNAINVLKISEELRLDDSIESEEKADSNEEIKSQAKEEEKVPAEEIVKPQHRTPDKEHIKTTIMGIRLKKLENEKAHQIKLQSLLREDKEVNGDVKQQARKSSANESSKAKQHEDESEKIKAKCEEKKEDDEAETCAEKGKKTETMTTKRNSIESDNNKKLIREAESDAEVSSKKKTQSTFSPRRSGMETNEEPKEQSEKDGETLEKASLVTTKATSGRGESIEAIRRCVTGTFNKALS